MQRIKIATEKEFGKEISEIDRRLETYEMLLKEGFLMFQERAKKKLKYYVSKSSSLLRD